MLKKMVWIGAAIVAVGCPVGIALSQSPQNADPVAQQLIGRWEGQVKNLSVPVGMQFSPTGKLIAAFQTGLDSETRMAFSVNYSIDSKPKPMHLNLKLEKPNSEKDKQPVLTIFDFPNPGTLRIHVKNLEPGKPRQTQFDQSVDLSKTSDSAIVFPEAAKLTQAARSTDGEGQLVMQNLAMSSLFYTLEMQQFPTTLDRLGLSNSATQNYRYQLQAKSDQLTLIARPKKQNLKSYIAVVLRFPIEGQDYSVTKVCESVRPSQIAPPMPKTSTSSNLLEPIDSIQCGIGSKAIAF